MTPEDVLLEAIAAASLHGDSPWLRRQEIAKLRDSLKRCPPGWYVAQDGPAEPDETA